MTALLHDTSKSSRRTPQRRSLLAKAVRKYRSLFTIDVSQATFVARGFASKCEPMRLHLEQVGKTFLTGFNCGLVEEQIETLQNVIERVGPDQRGFAVEGAAMGTAIADALMLGGSRLNVWVQRNEAAYTYLAHVGAGWALARVPWRRTAILSRRDRIHGWLVFDGLGFHDAYFMPGRVLRGWRRTRTGYAANVYDQGIGRALWFIAGGEIEYAISAVAGFASARQPDLWSGLGLALTYAGGASTGALSAAVTAAGRFQANLAQGAAFAAEARDRASHIPEHTKQAVAVLTGRDAEAVAKLVRASRAALSCAAARADTPLYEVWRRDVQRTLVQP